MPEIGGSSRKRSRDVSDLSPSGSTPTKRSCGNITATNTLEAASRPGSQGTDQSTNYNLRTRCLSHHDTGFPHIAGSGSTTSPSNREVPDHHSPTGEKRRLSRSTSANKNARTVNSPRSKSGSVGGGSRPKRRAVDEPAPAPRFPDGTWVWVKVTPADVEREAGLIFDDFRVAKIEASAPLDLGKEFKVKWATGGRALSVPSSRVLCELSEREKEIVFDGPPFPGRAASFAQVESMLGGERILPNAIQFDNVPASRRSETGQRLFPNGFVFTNATANWEGDHAMGWLCNSSSTFDPDALAGMLSRNAHNIPERAIAAVKGDPSAPTFANCMYQLLLLTNQIEDKQSPIYQKLFTLAHTLPCLLLRVNKALGSGLKVHKVKGFCTRFLNGQWEKLFNDAVKHCTPREWRQARDDDNEPPTSKPTPQQVHRAEEAAQLGNFSKARRALKPGGLAKGFQVLDEMKAKFPEAPPPRMPAVAPQIAFENDYVDDAVRRSLAKAMTRANMQKEASKAPRLGAPDQWGFRMREIISVLLADPVSGELFFEVLIKTRQAGYLPPLYAPIFRGGRLIPLSKLPKAGSRPIVIGDALRRLYERAIFKVTGKYLGKYFEETYENCVQFSVGTSGGTEKCLAAIQTFHRGHAAPVNNGSARPNDPRCTIALDSSNAFNTISRQAVVDITSGVFGDRTYDQGHISSDTPPPPPHLRACTLPQHAGTLRRQRKDGHDQRRHRRGSGMLGRCPAG